MKHAHLKIGELVAQNKDLEQKVAALTVELTAARGDKPTRRKKATTLGYDDVLKDLGKKFAVTGELWLDTAVFVIPLAVTANDSPNARFYDDDTYDQGTITELYRHIPLKYHEDMCNLPEFAQVVSILAFWYWLTLTLLLSVLQPIGCTTTFWSLLGPQNHSHHFRQTSGVVCE